MKLPVPEVIMAKIQEIEDLPNYLNRNQIALALEVSTGTIDNWRSANRRDLPAIDLQVGLKKYWLPSTIAPFIEMYRRSKNKPIK